MKYAKKYQSKKDPEVYASFDLENEKYSTVTMIYLSGENKGKSFSITTSTLKRWWKPVDEEEKSTLEILNVDVEQLSKPYKPDVTPRYIPKPQSVIDYENKKSRKNFDIPDFEKIVEVFGSILTKVNENSCYIKFADKTTLWRKASTIHIYANEDSAVKLSTAGLLSTANKDKDRPFKFEIKTDEEFEKVKEALLNE